MVNRQDALVFLFPDMTYQMMDCVTSYKYFFIQ